MKKLNLVLAFALSLTLFLWSFIFSSVSAYEFVPVEIQLTIDSSDQFDPSISGPIVVYSDRRNADSDIYYYDIENEEEVQVTSGGGDQLLNDVSGNQIVYTDYGSGNADIWLYNIDTGDTQQITYDTANQRRPAISGNLIVYEDDRNGTNYDIYLFDLDSMTETQLTTSDSHERKPDISGNIVVWEDFRNGNADVYMIDLSEEDPEIVAVTDNPAQDVDPAVEGDTIVFGSNRNSVGDIFLYRISDGVILPVTGATEDYERNPDISGDYIAYESYAAGDADIWVYSISLGVHERVTVDPAEQYLHALSGNRVVYTDNRNEDLDIYMTEFEFISDLEVDPLSLDFGDIELGSASTQIVTVTNSGGQNCTLSVDLTLGSSSDFSITPGPDGQIVMPDETVDVEITFSPVSIGVSNGILEIGTDITNPKVEVQLVGNGVPAEDPPEELIAEILDFIEDSVDEGTLMGSGNGNSPGNRLNALINMIEAAGDLVESGDIDSACEQLMAAYKKCDGEPRPPDFVEGESADDLAGMILSLMENLGC